MTSPRPPRDHRDGEGRRDSWSRSAPSQRRRTTDPARLAAFDVIREVAESDAYANLVLPSALRRRQVSGRDAAFATELCYGTLRMRGRYDAIIAMCTQRLLPDIDEPVLDALRLGAHQLLGMRVPPHAAVSETVALVRDRVGEGSAHFTNAVLRTIAETPLDEWLERIAPTSADHPIGHLAAVESHPAWIVRALRESLVMNGRAADDVGKLLVADNTVGPLHLAARPSLVTRAELIDELGESATPGRYAPTAVYWSGDPRSVESVRVGRASVQDEGSQLVALVVAAATVSTPDVIDGPEERWLDMCAGPGGKAAMLASLAQEKGAFLVANEVQEHRARLVEHALEPFENAEVWCSDGRTIGADQPGSFDRVLVDAPCTGLGALRRRPEARWRRTPSDVGHLGDIQRELLASALEAVRPGGVVAYVTCSPHIAETRLVVDDVIKRRPEVSRVDASAALAAVTGNIDGAIHQGAIQLWTDIHGTDGMFVQLLTRS